MSTDISYPFDLLDQDYGSAAPDFSQHDDYGPSRVERFLTWHSRVVDKVALDLMEKAFLFGEPPDLGASVPERMARLRELYGAPGLLASPESFFAEPDEPRGLRLTRLDGLDDGGERLRLTFDSTYQTYDGEFCDEFGCHAANAEVTAHIWRHPDRAQPTVVCLHCWCGGYLRFEERIFAVKKLYDQGFNVVVVTLPFHGDRTPTDALFSGQFFPSPDLRRTNEAFGQAVADVRLLTRWLRKKGHTGPMGVMGISLGGYLSALIVSLSDDYDFAVPIIAPVSFGDILWWHGSEREARSRFEDSGINLEFLRNVWALHCPLSYDLQIPKDRVLIVAGAGDEVVRPAQSLALWSHWDEPELRWFIGSHLGNLRWLAGSFTGGGGVFDFMSPVVDWLDELEF